MWRARWKAQKMVKTQSLPSRKFLVQTGDSRQGGLEARVWPGELANLPPLPLTGNHRCSSVTHQGHGIVGHKTGLRIHALSPSVRPCQAANEIMGKKYPKIGFTALYASDVVRGFYFYLGMPSSFRVLFACQFCTMKNEWYFTCVSFPSWVGVGVPITFSFMKMPFILRVKELTNHLLWSLEKLQQGDLRRKFLCHFL